MSLPNVVLLVMDACRADHLSCYGYERPTTPNIDRIAANGTLYENAISPAVWTVPSHASMFTGMYLSGHGLYGRNLKLRSDIPTIATYLKRNGYKTAAFTANTLIGEPTGLSRGYDELYDMRHIVADDAKWKSKLNSLYRKLYFADPESKIGYDRGAWRLNREMKKWVDGQVKGGGKRPFFIFANYMETHLPYVPSKESRSKFLTPEQEARWRTVNQNPWQYISKNVTMDSEDFQILKSLYDAQLSYLDEKIGEIYDFLHEKGLLKNTLFIVTSDHGENLGDHNLMDHQYCVYDTLARVPLVVNYPASNQGIKISSQVQSLDILPTVIDLLNQDEDPDLKNIQGQSLVPDKIEAKPREFTVTEYLAPQLHSFRREAIQYEDNLTKKLRAIRTLEHKFIASSDGQNELYDLRNDPQESRNLIHEDAQLAAQMEARLADWLEKHALKLAVANESVDTKIEERLEALGYI